MLLKSNLNAQQTRPRLLSQELGIASRSTYPASVHVDGRLVPHGAELVLVVAEELEGEVVVPGVVIVPGDGVDAGVGEVLPEKVAKLFFSRSH